MAETPLILTEATQCTSCHCNCHCDETLHISSDELDTGGPCACEECKHEV